MGDLANRVTAAKIAIDTHRSGMYTSRMEFRHHAARRFAPRKTGDASPLGQLENAVMDVIWSQPGPVSVGDVQAALPTEPHVAYTTVKTTMERLADKGILSRTKPGRAYSYQSAVSRDELERRIVSKVLDRLVEQFPNAVASFFIRPEPELTEEQLTLLSEAIERRRSERHD